MNVACTVIAGAVDDVARSKKATFVSRSGAAIGLFSLSMKLNRNRVLPTGSCESMRTGILLRVCEQPGTFPPADDADGGGGVGVAVDPHAATTIDRAPRNAADDRLGVLPGHDAGANGWMEWVHRTIGFAVGILILGVALLAVVGHRDRPSIVGPSVAAVGIALFQAYLGQQTVAQGNSGPSVTAHLATA